jgi:hypothetical protein
MSDEPSANRDVGQSSADPALPTHSDDGVDLTLIRWMLSLTPEERLQVLQNQVNGILSIRRANERR